MTTTATVARLQIPAGVWTLDPNHTSVAFVARHLMVTKVRGLFTDFAGEIEVADNLTDSTVKVKLEAGSITTHSPDRDNHLVSPDFFDVGAYPHVTFVSTGIREDGHNWILTGDLTIKDVTRPVTLEVVFDGIEVNPWGKTVAAFSATTEIDREDWGLTWNVALESGGWLVSKKVRIEIEAQMVRP